MEVYSLGAALQSWRPGCAPFDARPTGPSCRRVQLPLLGINQLPLASSVRAISPALSADSLLAVSCDCRLSDGVGQQSSGLCAETTDEA